MGHVEKCPTPYATILSNDLIEDSSSNGEESQDENISISDNVASPARFDMAQSIIIS